MRLTAYVSEFAPPRLMAWGKSFGGRWLFAFVREQHLAAAGERSCRYHNTERLTGALAPLMFALTSGNSRRLLTRVAADLKRHAEAMYRDTGSGPGLDPRTQRTA